MDDPLYLSIGKASPELGASPDALRALCKSGAIQCRVTAGGQFRIPVSEVERLKATGLPPTPLPLPGDTVSRNGSPNRHRRDDAADPHQAAGKTPEVVQAYAGVARKQAMIEEREADWQLLEIEDRFQQREDEIQQERRKRDSEAQRTEWLREAEEAALSAFDDQAPDADAQIRLDLHRAVRERLAALNPIPSTEVTAMLIVNVVYQFVDRHREQQEANRILLDAIAEGLPRDARTNAGDAGLSEWQMKLVQAIQADLGDGDQPLDKIRTAVDRAIADVTREFERHETDRQAEDADATLRRNVIEELTRPLRGRLSDDDTADMMDAVEARLAQLPRGLRRSKLETACRETMVPWSMPLEQADERERRRQIREPVINGAWWEVRHLPADQRDQALADMRRAMEQADPSDQREAEDIRDEALKLHIDAHERRRQAEGLAHEQKKLTEQAAQQKQREADERRSTAERRVDALLLDTIESAVAREERDGLELDGPLDRVNFKFEIRDVIRQPVIEWAARISNLTDEILKREIERKAGRAVQELVPEER